MPPAQESPEEDPRRTRLEGAAGTPAEAPADSGGGTDADKAAQADNEVQADKAVQAGTEMVAHHPSSPTAASPMEAGSPVGAGTAMNVATPASALSTARGDSVDAAVGRDWSEVLAMFVDDPRGSVTEASAMVDEAINAFIAAARGRQTSLAASWQADDTDTEQLRMALRDYRTFWSSVTQLP